MNQFQFFIVTSSDGLYGHYGKGATIEEARSKWKVAKGRKKGHLYIEQVFTSELPFAPHDREATAGEADAWVGQDGSISTLRCQRTILLEEHPKAKKVAKS